MTRVIEAHHVIHEELTQIGTLEAGRVLDFVNEALTRGDFRAMRSEGHHWSGQVALMILDLADAMEEATQVTSTG